MTVAELLKFLADADVKPDTPVYIGDRPIDVAEVRHNVGLIELGDSDSLAPEIGHTGRETLHLWPEENGYWLRDCADPDAPPCWVSTPSQ